MAKSGIYAFGVLYQTKVVGDLFITK
ncbi:hypothetical protein SAMN04487886_12137 [Clostridium sp. DSM 8431]|nr:hypothetical protein SAMN04487886_12137 [Clostridium sp. DSM 8431]